MRRLLVTGGAGFIGANFCHYWGTAHPADRLVVLDLLTYAGNPASIGSLIKAGRLRFVQGDIADRERVEALLKQEQIDTVVNFAARSVMRGRLSRHFWRCKIAKRSGDIPMAIYLAAASLRSSPAPEASRPARSATTVSGDLRGV